MMKFEAPSSTKEKNLSLYPERQSEGIQDKIKKLSDFETGQAEIIELSREEKEEIRSFEEVLGTTLEKVHEITPKEATFYAEYFLSPEGKKDLENVTGTAFVGSEIADAEQFFYSAAEKFLKLKTNERNDLAGRSRDYGEKELLEKLSETLSSEGQIEISGQAPPAAIRLALTPGENLKKIEALKKFKGLVKARRQKIGEEALLGKSENFRKILFGLLDLYQSRTNVMLADSTLSILAIKKKAEVLGKDSLEADEKKLLSDFMIPGDTERNLSRYDKFLFGASRDYNSQGQRVQVSGELKKFSDQLQKEYTDSVLERDDRIREKGVDTKKINSRTIDPEAVEKLAEETLAEYGLLSGQAASEYTSDRSQPAPDDKWQFVMRDEFGTMSVDGKRKVIRCGRGKQSAANLIPITLAHEIEGHVLQMENRKKIPLKLFEKMGTGRSEIFSECGAMSNQDYASREAFGYDSPPHPHYIRAMERKLAGGNYLECLKSFYDSALEPVIRKKKLGKISEEEMKGECQKNLKLAINRTKRLFSGSLDLSSETPYLAKSKDTVYLEQVMLFQELKKQNLEKYAFISGANLDALIFIMESGFLKPENIQKPKYHALEIWQRMKKEYLIEEGK